MTAATDIADLPFTRAALHAAYAAGLAPGAVVAEAHRRASRSGACPSR